MTFAEGRTKQMNIDSILKQAQGFLVPAVISLAKAVAIWYVGRWAIGLGIGVMRKTLTHNKLDATLVRYICSIVAGLLTVFLALGVLSVVGIETTSFAAIAAGAGLAIGAAWSGMLSNFAAGVFMIIMKPFKVGDEIEAGGVRGTVREIGLFASEIDTEEKVYTIVGNAKFLAGKISNFTTNPVRLCAIQFTVPTGSAFRERMEKLEETLNGIEHVEPKSAEIKIVNFDGAPVLRAVTACHQQYYEEVRGVMADRIERPLCDIGFGSAPSGAEEASEDEGGIMGEAAEGGEEEGGAEE
jgi:small conductance mechanosensitive channel